jgi:hypothetical protein
MSDCPPDPPARPPEHAGDIHVPSGLTSPVVIGPADRWSLGLSGMAKIVANASAVGLVFLFCWYLMGTFLAQSREDRIAYRNDLQLMHEDSQRKWEAINANQRALIEMHGTVRNGQSATVELTGAIRTLTEEIRRLKDQTEQRNRRDGDKPPDGDGPVMRWLRDVWAGDHAEARTVP